ncbi:MAG: PH domain-containing protein [Actinomycetota bacterium]|nr:PH domain-containing protein [Actinomycetota bacterium]
MAFPRKLLAEHEILVFDLKPHWVALAPAALWTLLIVVAGGFGVALLDDPEWARLAVVAIALVLFFFLALIPFLRWMYTNFVLTSDRLITRTGIIAKHSKEIPLERINDVTFTQSVLERMLGAGDLLVESAGERGQTRISNVRKPEDVQLTIYKETEANNNRMLRGGESTQSGAQREPTVPEQIEALARLNKQGVISDTEFESKKQELLKRI